MRDGLIRAGGVVADGLQVAAPFVPGGAIVSAALAGANTAAGYTGGGVGGVGAKRSSIIAAWIGSAGGSGASQGMSQ